MAGAVAAGTESLAAPHDLDALKQHASACTRCVLAETRTQVVFGAGSPTARLLLIGEAPGFHEDAQGVPLSGAPGDLLTKLLADSGLRREDVYIANVLKCRPPATREPLSDEIEACQPWLVQQIEQIRPLVIATLGNVATRLLTGSPDAITRSHGVARDITVGSLPVKLFPLYHPAAALYTQALLAVLEEDFHALAALLAREAGEPEPPPRVRVAVGAPVPPETSLAAAPLLVGEAPAGGADEGQLGLF